MTEPYQEPEPDYTQLYLESYDNFKWYCDYVRELEDALHFYKSLCERMAEANWFSRVAIQAEVIKDGGATAANALRWPDEQGRPWPKEGSDG